MRLFLSMSSAAVCFQSQCGLWYTQLKIARWYRSSQTQVLYESGAAKATKLHGLICHHFAGAIFNIDLHKKVSKAQQVACNAEELNGDE